MLLMRGVSSGVVNHVVLAAMLAVGVACGGNEEASDADGGVKDAGADAHSPCAADGWRHFDGQGDFSFRAPCSVTGGRMQGIDSLVGEYKDVGMAFGYDSGAHSSPLTEWSTLPGYLKSPTTIDSRSAYFVVAEDPAAADGLTFLIGLHVPEVDGTGLRLTIRGGADSAARRDVLRAIFETVDFP